MATQLGDELIWWCPSLDDGSVGTALIDDLVGTNDGTLVAMEAADWLADTTSSGIRCLSMDGVAEYVNLTTLTTIDSIPALSISFWFYRSSAAHHGSFGKENGTTRNYIDVDGAGILYGFLGTSIYGSVACTVTGWHHFTMVFDGTLTGNANRLKLYVDGTIQSLSFTGTVGTTTPAMGAITFRAGLHGGQYSTGRFDDMRVFDVALPLASVVKLASIRGFQPDTAGIADNTEFFTETSGLTLFAMPFEEDDISLEDWSSLRRECTEEAAPNLGLYSALLDATYAKWYVFPGTARPASWDDAIDILDVSTGRALVNVLPFFGTIPERTAGTTITVFLDEEVEVTVTLATAALSGMEFQFVVEDKDRNDILVLEGLDVTTTDDTFTVTIPSTITGTMTTHHWALRDLTSGGNTVVGHGLLCVAYAANEDA